MFNLCKLICTLVFFALCPYFVYVVGFVIKHFISTTMLKSMRKYTRSISIVSKPIVFVFVLLVELNCTKLPYVDLHCPKLPYFTLRGPTLP